MTNDFYSLYQDCGSEGSLQTPPGISGAVSAARQQQQPPMVALALSWAAKVLQGGGAAAESPRSHRSGGLAVTVRRLLPSGSSSNDLSAAGNNPGNGRHCMGGRRVAGWCAGGANAIVNSDTYLCSRIKTHGA